MMTATTLRSQGETDPAFGSIAPGHALIGWNYELGGLYATDIVVLDARTLYLAPDVDRMAVWDRCQYADGALRDDWLITAEATPDALFAELLAHGIADRWRARAFTEFARIAGCDWAREMVLRPERPKFHVRRATDGAKNVSRIGRDDA